MRSKQVLQYVLAVIALAVLYHGAARLGLSMAYVQQNTSPVWPPSGIALAALLLFGSRLWPGIALGVILGSLLTGLPLGWISLGLGLGNTLEALLGAYLLRRFIDFRPDLSRIRDVVGLALAAAASTSVSATIGSATIYFFASGGGVPFSTLWFTWWIGNLLGILVVTPFLLVLRTHLPLHWKRLRYLEAAIFYALLALVAWYVFENQPGNGALHQALIYVIFPFAIWAGLRLELVGAATAVVVVSGMTIWGTVHGSGPFAQPSLNESLILLQTFTGVVALTSLTLASSASERRHADEALRRRVADLAALNDASKVFLSNLDKSATYAAICRLAVERLGLSAAWMDRIAYEPPGPRPVAVYTRSGKERDPDWERFYQLKEVQEITARAEGTAQASAAGPLAGRTTSRSLQESTPWGHFCSIAAFPLSYGGKVIGVLGVASADLDAFSPERNLLIQSYANLAAVAIQNSVLFDQVSLGNERLHALSQRLLEVQEAERLHLSRELHDESGQILAALMVRLGLLERDAESPDQIHAHAGELKRIISDVVSNLHQLAVKLRPASLDHLGLVTALQQYIEEFNRQYSLDVQFEAVGLDAQRLPAEIETALFRIVQESLTNVALHAQATRIDVLLNRRNGCLVTIVEDNGIGFTPDPVVQDQGRLGLFGMRERVEMLGGKLVVESAPGKGTMISWRCRMAIRVLIADDHAIVRAGLRALLKGEAGMALVGEATDGEEALRLAGELLPDILVLDLSMPDIDGIQVTRKIRAGLPGVRVLILTVHEDEALLREAIRAGASGYILKQAAEAELISAIHTVQIGDIYVHPKMIRALLEKTDRPPVQTAAPPSCSPRARRTCSG